MTRLVTDERREAGRALRLARRQVRFIMRHGGRSGRHSLRANGVPRLLARGQTQALGISVLPLIEFEFWCANRAMRRKGK